jgi:hypothetical protein
MAKKTGDGTPKNGTDNNSINITTEPGTDPKALLARAVLRPSVRAAVTARTYSKPFGELDVNSLIDELLGQIHAVNDGDMRRIEAMLVAQAHTLEAIFHELMGRAALNMGEYLGAAETYLRLGLKAQSQCRATLETLAAIKNPAPLTFVKQANIAHGPQQVNNGAQTAEASRARETEIPQSKLLEQHHDERLDGRTAQATVGTNSPLETVAALDRTADTGRQSPDGPQSLQGRDVAGAT